MSTDGAGPTETAPPGHEAETAAETGKPKRERSTIEFPYSDLGSAIEIARTINNRAGVECEVAQLAAWLGQSTNSGTFRARYSAARLFGLTETERGGRVRLTPLGRDVLNAQKTNGAKVQAFLNVELFHQMYERHKGNPLPPSAALERMVTTLGVAPKQAERARQAFIKSAQVAGFIDQKTGVFIAPAIRPSNEPDATQESDNTDASRAKDAGSARKEDDLSSSIDPIIKGLIDRLPEAGSVWPSSQRQLWLGILENTFQLVYKEETDEPSSSPDREERAPRPSAAIRHPTRSTET